MVWLTETWQQRVQFSLKAGRELFRADSPFQTVQVVETEPFGRVLVLDGVFQTSVEDEFLYHEPMVHPLMTMAAQIQRVLIVGGGDGGTAREVLRYADVERVEMCEIDELVVNTCREHLPEIGGDAWKDPRLSLVYRDAAAYVAEAGRDQYDAIIVDGSDPIGPGEALFGPSFFTDCKRVLRPGGLYVMQSGSPFMMGEVFAATVHALREAFAEAAPFLGSVPLYSCGPWSWTLAGEQVRPQRARAERIAPFADRLRYYTPEVHAAGFVQPAYVARQLAGAP